MDLDARIRRLESAVSHKNAEWDTLGRADKAEAWARIQAEAPDLAEWLTAMRQAFGRPARVRVELNGERVA